ncbi:DUF2334 domain-containing protein [Clostridium taeniosporum]|uniref:DUF2334 domain-containing protein n=1 Tax=Clostridium taeniosporum TaxID=394958 RepID=A0A1D7XJN7_9CLOT|nr:DUF2334 domain-containing protein [Clostridium taeniosporum]AOR23543.1 DUF2334 domain-containing protein [Clostridium taeniosporum]
MISRNKLSVYSKLTVLVFIFIIISNVYFIKNTYGIESNNKILILYDVYKDYGKEKNALNYINRICLDDADYIDIIKCSAYKEKDLTEYNSIFVLNFSNTNLSEILKENLNRYDKKIIWIGKKTYKDFLNIDKVTYINELDFNKFSYNEIKDNIYKNFNRKNKENIYLYISDVTPFNELNTLVEEIDYLKELGIRFFIEVPPIFKNDNLKAMNRFAEVLRYAQANGGGVILNFPPLVNLNVNGRDIEEKISLGFKNYINYFVYPISISISDYFLYREDLKELFEKTNTIFIDSNINIEILDFDKYSIKANKNIIEKVNSYSIDHLHNNLAVTVSAKLPIDEFKKKVMGIFKKEVYFKDIRNINSSFTIDNLNIRNNKNGVFLNEENVTQSYFINNEKYSDLKIGEDKKINEDTNINLTKTNKILVIISIVVTLIFILIVFISFNIDRRKFFK